MAEKIKRKYPYGIKTGNSIEFKPIEDITDPVEGEVYFSNGSIRPKGLFVFQDSEFIPVGAGGADTSIAVNQADHGFVQWQQVRWDITEAEWVTANITVESQTGTHTVVDIDGDDFRIQADSIFEKEAHGLTVGQVYFSDNSGNITTAETTTIGQFIALALYAVDENFVQLLNTREVVQLGTGVLVPDRYQEISLQNNLGPASNNIDITVFNNLVIGRKYEVTVTPHFMSTSDGNLGLSMRNGSTFIFIARTAVNPVGTDALTEQRNQSTTSSGIFTATATTMSFRTESLDGDDMVLGNGTKANTWFSIREYNQTEINVTTEFN